MPIPTAYTETELAEYMRAEVLRGTADALGWSDAAPLLPAVRATLRMYGVADIALATNIAKLCALADIAAWSAAAAESAKLYSFGSVGQTYQRQQINEQCRAMLAAAKAAATEAGYLKPAPKQDPSLPHNGSVATEISF